MKYKFKEAINKYLPPYNLSDEKRIEKATNACNTLHQQVLLKAEEKAWIEGSNAAHKLTEQAMKDEREKYEIKRTNVSEEINKIARELHFAGYTLLEGQLKRIARDL